MEAEACLGCVPLGRSCTPSSTGCSWSIGPGGRLEPKGIVFSAVGSVLCLNHQQLNRKASKKMISLTYRKRLMFDDTPVYYAACCLLATARQEFQVVDGACVGWRTTCGALRGFCFSKSVVSYSSDGESERVPDHLRDLEQARVDLWGLVWTCYRRHGDG